MQIANPIITSRGTMALPAAALEVRSVMGALKRHIATIEANTSNPKILNATYELESIVAAMWPGDDKAACADRWSDYGLTPIQSRIADFFVSRLGRAITRDSLATCWTSVGLEEPGSKNLDVQICWLRKRLKASPYVIENVWGIGYRMELKPT